MDDFRLEVFQQWMRLSAQCQVALDHCLVSCHVSYQQWFVLEAFISQPLTLDLLSKQLKIDMNSLQPVVDALVQKNLLHHSFNPRPSIPLHLIEITAKGKTIHKKASTIVDGFANALLSRVGSVALQLFHNLIGDMAMELDLNLRHKCFNDSAE